MFASQCLRLFAPSQCLTVTSSYVLNFDIQLYHGDTFIHELNIMYSRGSVLVKDVLAWHSKMTYQIKLGFKRQITVSIYMCACLVTYSS